MTFSIPSSEFITSSIVGKSDAWNLHCASSWEIANSGESRLIWHASLERHRVFMIQNSSPSHSPFAKAIEGTTPIITQEIAIATTSNLSTRVSSIEGRSKRLYDLEGGFNRKCGHTASHHSHEWGYPCQKMLKKNIVLRLHLTKSDLGLAIRN